MTDEKEVPTPDEDGGRTNKVRMSRRTYLKLGAVSVGVGGSQFIADRAAATAQAPYGGESHAIPGRVEAEDFDEGGEDVAYNDAGNGNKGGAYRDTDVDIEVTDDESGEYNIGWIREGEWLEYTVDVTDATVTYDVNIRVAGKNDAAGGISLSLDGQTVSSVDLPDAGGWQDWTTVTLTDVSVPSSGEQVSAWTSTTKTSTSTGSSSSLTGR